MWLCQKSEAGLIPMYETEVKKAPEGYEIIDSDEGVTYPIIQDGRVIQFENKELLTQAWEDMDADIVNESAQKIGTLNRESMAVFVSAYLFRIAKPEMYLEQGLFAEIAIGDYTQGEMLDTVEKIEGYYSEILFHLDVDRTNKIKNYLMTKAQLGF